MDEERKRNRAEYMRGWRKVSPKYTAQKQTAKYKWGAWKRTLWLRYKVTPDWVGIKFLEQQGKCAICRHDLYYNTWGLLKDKTYSIHIDHDHNTGKPRGLLCQNCNIALGKFQDNRRIVESAAYYLVSYWDNE